MMGGAARLVVLLWWLLPVSSAVAAGTEMDPAGGMGTDHVFLGDFELCAGPQAASVAGACWILSSGAAAQGSCSNTCAAVGRVYSVLTATYAGSSGTDEACSEVLTRLVGAPSPMPVTGGTYVYNGVAGLGCGYYGSPGQGIRLISQTEPMAWLSLFRRACACAPPPPPSIRYVPPTRVLAVDEPMTSWAPTVTGSVGVFQSQPGLPAGLSMNSTTGVISGTPLFEQDMAMYEVTAQSFAGTLTTMIGIEIVTPTPGISYPGPVRELLLNVPISPWAPQVVGVVSGFEAVPALPAGLSLNSVDGVIAGAPTQVQPLTEYTITANATGGTVSTTIGIMVSQPPPCAPYGTQVGNRCWYLGQPHQSCAQVCADHGGYHAATASFAGSGGTNANCTQVLRAFVGPDLPAATAVTTLNGFDSLGCGIDPSAGPPLPAPYRVTSTTTSEASAWFFQRACACND